MPDDAPVTMAKGGRRGHEKLRAMTRQSARVMPVAPPSTAAAPVDTRGGAAGAHAVEEGFLEDRVRRQVGVREVDATLRRGERLQRRAAAHAGTGMLIAWP